MGWTLFAVVQENRLTAGLHEEESFLAILAKLTNLARVVGILVVLAVVEVTPPVTSGW